MEAMTNVNENKWLFEMADALRALGLDAGVEHDGVPCEEIVVLNPPESISIKALKLIAEHQPNEVEISDGMMKLRWE